MAEQLDWPGFSAIISSENEAVNRSIPTLASKLQCLRLNGLGGFARRLSAKTSAKLLTLSAHRTNTGLPDEKFCSEVKIRLEKGTRFCSWVQNELHQFNQFGVPSIHHIKEFHRSTFYRVLKDAGALRAEGDRTEFERILSPKANHVLPCLRDLERNAHGWFHENNLEKGFEAIARYNAELKRIRPFAFGNKEVAAHVVDFQAKFVIERELERIKTKGAIPEKALIDFREICVEDQEYLRVLKNAISFRDNQQSHQRLKALLIDGAGLRETIERQRDRDRER